MIILPHGGWALIPATLATMAWMTALSLDGCDYARLTGPAVKTLTQSSIYPYVEIGFTTYRIPNFYSNYQTWSIRFNDPRIPYGQIDFTKSNSNNDPQSSSSSSSSDFGIPENDEQNNNGNRIDLDQDSARTAATRIDPSQGFFWSLGSMSHKFGIVFGGSAALFFWVPCLCLSYSDRTWRIGGMQLLFAAFFHLFSLVWFFNSLCLERASKCHWHYGSYASLISVLLYSASFVCVFWRYPKPIVVRMVQERIKQEFQRYERARGPDYLTSSFNSRNTNATDADSVNSQSSERLIRPPPPTVGKSGTSRRNFL